VFTVGGAQFTVGGAVFTIGGATQNCYGPPWDRNMKKKSPGFDKIIVLIKRMSSLIKKSTKK
jgi:hypothetical protein